MSKKLTNANIFINKISFIVILIVVLTAHTLLYKLCVSISSYVERKP